MPEWLSVVLLGVIEGVTEFLPISSTGHLLLVENAHLLPQQSDLFNITIQSGAAVAVLAVFGGRIRDLRGEAGARLRDHRDRRSRDQEARLRAAQGGGADRLGHRGGWDRDPA